MNIWMHAIDPEELKRRCEAGETLTSYELVREPREDDAMIELEVMQTHWTSSLKLKVYECVVEQMFGEPGVNLLRTVPFASLQVAELFKAVLPETITIAHVLPLRESFPFILSKMKAGAKDLNGFSPGSEYLSLVAARDLSPRRRRLGTIRIPRPDDRDRCLVEIVQTTFPAPIFAWLSPKPLKQYFGHQALDLLKSSPKVAAVIARLCLVKLPEHICRERTSAEALSFFDEE